MSYQSVNPMQGDAGEFAERLEGSQTTAKSAAVARSDKSGERIKIQEAENQITDRMRPSLAVLDICDQRFLCRIAKKLGCQFCAKK